jgi:hypothetical protein
LKRLHIFRAGRHTASCGTALNFDEQALQGAVDAYDPSVHEAPIVAGHPKDNGPAFGWIKGLSFSEGNLHAEPHQVNPDFDRLVQAGSYKKISASFYSPDAPTNPVPGTWYLRHVGFLGAQPPAIKGLAPIGFAEAEEGVVEFGDRSDGRANDYITAGFLRNLREWMIGKYGRPDADAVVPGYWVENMAHVARSPDKQTIAPEYAEDSSMTPEELDVAQNQLQADQATFQAEQAAFSERATRVEATERAQRLAGIADSVDRLVQDGKVLPAERPRVVAFMASLAEDAEVSFSEDGKDQVQPAAQLLMGILSRLPKRVEFNEQAPGGQTDIDSNINADKLAREAVAFREAQRAKGIEVSTTDAVAAVQSGQA